MATFDDRKERFYHILKYHCDHNISATARRTKISRSLHYRWMAIDPSVPTTDPEMAMVSPNVGEKNTAMKTYLLQYVGEEVRCPKCHRHGLLESISGTKHGSPYQWIIIHSHQCHSCKQRFRFKNCYGSGNPIVKEIMIWPSSVK